METLTKKKILFVITKSNWGGAQKYVYTLATRFQEAGANVAVALGGTGEAEAPAGLLETRLAEAGVRTIFIQSFARDMGIFRDISAFFELLRIIKKENPDVLHLNSSKAGGIGTLAGRVAGIRRIIFTAHGFAHNEIRPFYQRTFIWIFSWLTILCAHAVIVLSNYELKCSPVIFFRRKLVVIHNGIDMHMQFDSGEKIRNAFPAGVRITGTIGELTKNKNQMALIEQAKANPDMFVAIVGEGEERQRLEAKIREYDLSGRVKLFLFIPPTQIIP